MKINALKEVSIQRPEEQIVCLNTFIETDLYALANCIKSVSKNPVCLSAADFITSSDCDLTLLLGQNDVGIIEIDNNKYECYLTSESYITMAVIIEKFVDYVGDTNCYNWLYDLNNPIDFLLSQNCKW